MAKKNRQRGNLLVWLDCEMTGLDPDRHVLLEIATIITNNDLEVVAEGPVLAIRQGPAALRRMDNWCRRTHARSGLIKRVRTEGVPLRAAEKATLEFVRKHCRERTAPLCGNSIGHDRRFLARYMPELHDFFHYQSIDVSTVKQLVRRWYGASCRPPKKHEEHLALADIRESIAELRFYRRKVFIKKPAVKTRRRSGS